MTAGSITLGWLVSLFLLVTLNVVVVEPMLCDLPGASASCTVTSSGPGEIDAGGGENITGTGFGESASFEVPLFGEVDFSDPLTLGATVAIVLVAVAAAAAAGGFLTSSASRGSLALAVFVALIMGVAVAMLAEVAPLFTGIPVVGAAIFGVYGVVGLVFLIVTSLELLAGTNV